MKNEQTNILFWKSLLFDFLLLKKKSNSIVKNFIKIMFGPTSP